MAILLKEIKAISYKYKGRRKLYLAHYYHQKPYKSNTLHYNMFHALVEVAEHHGGMLCIEKALIDIESKKMHKDYDLSIVNMAPRAPVEANAHNKGLTNVFLK